MATPRLLVEIATSLGSFQADFSRASAIAEANSRRINRSVEDINKTMLGIGRSVASSLAGVVGIPLTIGAAVGAAAHFLGDMTSKVEEDERSVAQLNATLRATGGSAGLTASALEQIGQELQGSTIFDDEKIRAAETALLRFRTVQGDTFREAIRLAPDVAAALGIDLVSAAQAIGKALTDPERGMRALKDAGIALTDSQKDLAAQMIETGDRAGAQKIVLEELKKSVGGAAEADNSGLYGSMKRLARAWDDLEKASGKRFLGSNNDLVDTLTQALERLRRKTEESNLSLKRLFTEPFALDQLAFQQFRALFGSDEARSTGIRAITGLPAAEVPLSPDAASAADAARNARIQERTEQADRDRLARLRSQAGSSTDEFANQLNQTRNFLAQRSALYTDAYTRDQISATEFFDRERALAKESYTAETNAINRRIELNQKLFNDPSVRRDEREQIARRTEGLVIQADQARFAFEQRILALDIQQGQAIERLKDEYADLGIKLKEISGDTVGAAADAFDQSNKKLRNNIAAELAGGDALARLRAQAAQADFDAYRERTIEQAALNRVQQSYSVILDEVSVKQGRIDLAQQTGAITELDSLRLKGEAAKSLIPQLQAVADAYEEIAIRTKDPA